LRPGPPAADGAQVLREVPGPAAVRQGLVPTGRVPVLLARARDGGRVLRLLPRLPRVLEAVRHGPAGRGTAQAVSRQRAGAPALHPAGAVHAVGGRIRSWAERGQGRGLSGAAAAGARANGYPRVAGRGLVHAVHSRPWRAPLTRCTTGRRGTQPSSPKGPGWPLLRSTRTRRP